MDFSEYASILVRNQSELPVMKTRIIRELIEDVTLKIERHDLEKALTRVQYVSFFNFYKELLDEWDVREARRDPRKFIEYVLRDTESQIEENFSESFKTEEDEDAWEDRIIHGFEPVGSVDYEEIDIDSGEPINLCEMHQEWHRIMSERDRCILIAPRGHGKTTNLIGRILFEIGRNPNLRIKIVSNTDDNAKKRIAVLAKHITSNTRLHRVFPNLKPHGKDEWSKQRIFVQRTMIAPDPSIEGYGVRSSGTGSRSDLIIFDDVCDRNNTLTNPGMREKVSEAVKTDWLATLTPNGRAWMIATLWHKKDITHELSGDTLIEFQKGRDPDQSNNPPGTWYVMFYAINEEFDPIWPEKWTRDLLKAKRQEIGRIAFNRAFRNIATDDGEIIVLPEHIQYYDLRKLPSARNMLTITSYDLALSSNPKDQNSYFVHLTAQIRFLDDMTFRIYILDCRRHRLSFLQQVQKIVNDSAMLQPDLILVESIYYQQALPETLIGQHRLPVQGVKPTQSKKFRLEAVSPMLENGTILFNKSLNPKIKQNSLIDEILDFPGGTHEDQVDAMNQLALYVQQYQFDLANYRKVETRKGSRAYTISA